MLTMNRKRWIALGVIVAVVASLVVLFATSGKKPLQVSADFVDTTGIYEGNEVDYLGVPVGHIVSITPAGTAMTVHMEIDPDTRIPADAGAEILQSALLTDRFIQVGPAYNGGPTLQTGAHIDVQHTRSPINIDDLGTAIDQLLQALNHSATQTGGVPGLIHGVALDLDGNGSRIRSLLVSAKSALGTINAQGPDMAAIIKDLNAVVSLINQRGDLVRRFTANLGRTTAAFASQSDSLTTTLRQLSDLSQMVGDFIKRDKAPLLGNLRDAAELTKTLNREKDTLARIFNNMPTGAENLARAYDPVAQAIRVVIAIRDAGPFSPAFNAAFCAGLLSPAACAPLTNPQGTGVLNQIMTGVGNTLPGSGP